MRHRKVDRELTASRRYMDKRSFVDIHGMEFLAGNDMSQRRAEVYERDRHLCRKCGRFCSWYSGEVHHVIPRGKGGSDDLENLQWRCGRFIGSCHTSEHPRVRFKDNEINV